MGHLKDPQPSDPHPPTVEAALMLAFAESDQDENAILAVWNDENGEVLVIVYQGRAYWP